MFLLKWAIVLAVIALVFGLFGFTGIASGFAAVAQVLFFIFLGLVVLFIILGVIAWKKIT